MTEPTPQKSRKPHMLGGLVLASAGLMAFLGTWEEGAKVQLTVYADKLAAGIPTVCKGLTRHVTTTPIIVGQRWTLEKCQAEEERAVIKLQRHLYTCFTIEPPQLVFDMATSHGWNNGVGATCGSLAMAAWKQGNWPLGCKRLMVSDGGKPVWSYVRTGRRLANGKWEMRFVQGLANRRHAEYKKCMEYTR